MENKTLYHHGVKGMKWGVRRKAKEAYEAHLKKNKGYIRNVNRYQEMPITRMTKDKRYSDYYVFDRKKKTIVAKSIVSSLGSKRVADITEADYERGEKLVHKLTNDWRTNRETFAKNLLDPID